jgi:hypothetical protein
MPNWCSNTVEILGDEAELDKVQAQLSTPYRAPHSDESVEEVVEGAFLLWNIIRPTDMHAYLNETREKPADLETLMAEVVQTLQTSNFWYHWNVRNWGTKWEIDDATIERSKNALFYSFDSAWAPPIEAMQTLFTQHPTLAMSLEYYEPNMGYKGRAVFNELGVVDEMTEMNDEDYGV